MVMTKATVVHNKGIQSKLLSELSCQTANKAVREATPKEKTYTNQLHTYFISLHISM